MGPVALHGGGEFLPGDEPFLDALLETAAGVSRSRSGDGSTNGSAREAIRVVIVPTAAARGLPDRAASVGVKAFERRARETGRQIRIETARIVDPGSAEDAACTARVAGADLVYLPGGDPDLVPRLFEGSAAGRALAAAHLGGAVIAGASAGAMGLAEWSWTPKGGIRGLGLAHGIVVVPHYDDIRRLAWQARLDEVAPPEFGYLGLDERTGVIGNGAAWRVAGPGAAYWFAAGASEPVVSRHGERITLLS